MSSKTAGDGDASIQKEYAGHIEEERDEEQRPKKVYNGYG
jgi:hypothetical protein